MLGGSFFAHKGVRICLVVLFWLRKEFIYVGWFSFGSERSSYMFGGSLLAQKGVPICLVVLFWLRKEFIYIWWFSFG